MGNGNETVSGRATCPAQGLSSASSLADTREPGAEGEVPAQARPGGRACDKPQVPSSVSRAVRLACPGSPTHSWVCRFPPCVIDLEMVGPDCPPVPMGWRPCHLVPRGRVVLSMGWSFLPFDASQLISSLAEHVGAGAAPGEGQGLASQWSLGPYVLVGAAPQSYGPSAGSVVPAGTSPCSRPAVWKPRYFLHTAGPVWQDGHLPQEDQVGSPYDHQCVPLRGRFFPGN